MRASCGCLWREGSEYGWLDEECPGAWASEGTVLFVKDGTAPTDGVVSSVALELNSNSDSADDVSGLLLVFSDVLSFFTFMSPPSFPLRVELMPSRWVLKSLFSMADAITIGRGLWR